MCIRDRYITHDLQAMRMRQRATRVSCILHLCAYVVSHSMCIRPQHLQLPHIHHLLRAQRLCTLVLSFTVYWHCQGSNALMPAAHMQYMYALTTCDISLYMAIIVHGNHYTNFTFVCPSVRAGGHRKPFDPY